jgi:hypothetical protein
MLWTSNKERCQTKDDLPMHLFPRRKRDVRVDPLHATTHYAYSYILCSLPNALLMTMPNGLTSTLNSAVIKNRTGTRSTLTPSLFHCHLHPSSSNPSALFHTLPSFPAATISTTAITDSRSVASQCHTLFLFYSSSTYSQWLLITLADQCRLYAAYICSTAARSHSPTNSRQFR